MHACTHAGMRVACRRGCRWHVGAVGSAVSVAGGGGAAIACRGGACGMTWHVGGAVGSASSAAGGRGAGARRHAGMY